MTVYYDPRCPPEVPHDRKSRISPARSARPRRARRRSYAWSGPRNGAGAWRGRRDSLLHGPQHARQETTSREIVQAWLENGKEGVARGLLRKSAGDDRRDGGGWDGSGGGGGCR